MTGHVNQEGLRIALPHVVLLVLQQAQASRGHLLALRRVSLSYATSELDDFLTSILPALNSRRNDVLHSWWGWQAAELFAAGIVNEAARGFSTTGHEGALLVLDLAPHTLRPHWYGWTLTNRDDFAIDELWHQLGRHLMTRTGRHQ